MDEGQAILDLLQEQVDLLRQVERGLEGVHVELVELVSTADGLAASAEWLLYAVAFVGGLVLGGLGRELWRWWHA